GDRRADPRHRQHPPPRADPTAEAGRRRARRAALPRGAGAPVRPRRPRRRPLNPRATRLVRTLRIATRRSALARAQAFQVGALLTQRTGVAVELVPLATTGDAHPDTAITAF